MHGKSMKLHSHYYYVPVEHSVAVVSVHISLTVTVIRTSWIMHVHISIRANTAQQAN